MPKFKRIGIIVNPIAGRGRGKELAERARVQLEASGREAVLSCAFELSISPICFSHISSLDCAVIVGGDGTLMHFLPVLANCSTPVYLLPAGNQSLFAGLHGMTASVELLLQTLDSGMIEPHFVPSIQERPFFSMASVGLDSAVIAEIAATRTGTVSNWSYVLPTVRKILSHQPPQISLSVDGKNVLSGESGFLIAANSPAYAIRICFAPEAYSRDDLIDVYFYPYRRFAAYLLWCLRCRISRATIKEGARHWRGKAVRIETNPQYPVQADGEFIGSTPAELIASGKKIAVLRPPA